MKKMMAALMLVAIARVASAAVSGTSHDLSTGYNGATVTGDPLAQTCIYCHTPHGSNTAITAAPLWNRAALGAVTWTMYTSSTLLNAIAATPNANSLTCLSCHEGSASIGLVYTYGSAAGGTNTQLFSASQTMQAAGLVGSDLSNDHPVSVDYDPTVKTNLNTVASVTAAGLKLYGTPTPTVECGSCHDPHSANARFLRIANTGSALCTTCHQN